MITRLQIDGFKNLRNVDIRFDTFTCVAGGNGVGKSNLFDAIRFLSAVADERKLDEAAIATFQPELAKMGYKFQFVTLAGFHALNLSMFDLARGYKDSGMAAYSKLQQAEFERESSDGYEAVKHQTFVGTGYFDAVQQVITGGASSTTALKGSTEAEQFHHDVEPEPAHAIA